MKKIIIILTLTLLSSSCLHSMQSCSSAQLEQANHGVAVRITGTRDGIDVVVPEQCAQHSEVLKLFLEDDMAPDANSMVCEKHFPLTFPLFNTFESLDFEIMKKHLEKIASNVGIQELFKDCRSEERITNLKQLLLADFFEIEQLKEAEISALKREFDFHPSQSDLLFLLDLLNGDPKLNEIWQRTKEVRESSKEEQSEHNNSESQDSESESEKHSSNSGSEHSDFESGSEREFSGSEHDNFGSEGNPSESEQDDNSTQSNNSQTEWVDSEEEESNFCSNLERQLSESEHDNSNSETEHNNPELEEDDSESIELMMFL